MIKIKSTYLAPRKANIGIIWIVSICVVVMLLFTNCHLLTLAIVSGESMYPTLENGELLLVDRIHRVYNKGDIIFAHVPTMYTDGEGIVKRVIAVAGDEVTIDYGKDEVTVNGEVIPEPYINFAESDPMMAGMDEVIVTYLVPDSCLFVMGDNRNHSMGSRSSEIGFIPNGNVIGKVVNILAD